jgi:hypothetical protein
MHERAATLLALRRSNVVGLRQHGVAAMHVPLGFARNLYTPPQPPDAAKDIDVLFFGAVLRC